MRTVLLTGATGFIGKHAAVALEAAGFDIRYATRSPDKARASDPGKNWVAFDVERPATMAEALDGCDAALYLVHGMGGGDADYPEHERDGAEAFAAAAAKAKLRRIVYLGGVMPSHDASKHLESRARTGEILRRGEVDTLELRAAMVMGAGSSSWTMVRDLARRLPAMLLPRWLKNVSYPVAIEDVVVGLIAALTLPITGSRIFDIPGRERVRHRDLIDRIALAMGHKRVMISVPVLSPRLSSYWIALVTRTSHALAKELVEGVRHDLEPSNERLWARIDHQPMPLDEAIRRALADDDATQLPSHPMRDRLQQIGEHYRQLSTPSPEAQPGQQVTSRG